MANRLMDPHELGWHSAACMRLGCVHGIKLRRSRPWLLDTNKKVTWANRIRGKIGGDLMKQPEWKLGDHCWYRPK